ncbi:peptidase inhibitor 16-like [Neoarius graeffei]|uniref:peptidase inhibitor 16-like n=1 Tax=Neoarius graeffei TaxID=443677 RepID=UPI00298C519F|nr:peptidase inhibitor 16-like [Neoarius graeffei]
MTWKTALYYTQFWLVLSLTSGLLTDEEKTQILDLHNQYRSMVTPQAANMQHMLWDNTIAQVAANYSTQCTWEHNSKVNGTLGESLFMTLGPLIITQPMTIWFNERQNYHFNNNSCTEGKLCGHYTQIVWANTTFVGCAAHFCPDVPNFKVQNATILVCNYFPPGNILRQSPYQEGPACFSCPNGTKGCVDNTCDLSTNFTSGVSAALIANLTTMENLANTTSAGSSAGFTKPSAATLMLAGLIAFYFRMI